jgi:hypothetical protein
MVGGRRWWTLTSKTTELETECPMAVVEEAARLLTAVSMPPIVISDREGQLTRALSGGYRITTA